MSNNVSTLLEISGNALYPNGRATRLLKAGWRQMTGMRSSKSMTAMIDLEEHITQQPGHRMLLAPPGARRAVARRTLCYAGLQTPHTCLAPCCTLEMSMMVYMKHFLQTLMHKLEVENGFVWQGRFASRSNIVWPVGQTGVPEAKMRGGTGQGRQSCQRALKCCT